MLAVRTAVGVSLKLPFVSSPATSLWGEELAPGNFRNVSGSPAPPRSDQLCHRTSFKFLMSKIMQIINYQDDSASFTLDSKICIQAAITELVAPGGFSLSLIRRKASPPLTAARLTFFLAEMPEIVSCSQIS